MSNQFECYTDEDFESHAKSQKMTKCKYPILSKPAVQLGEHWYSQAEFTDYILGHFKHNLRNWDNADQKACDKAERQAREIACENMHISGRYFCRKIEALIKPITPQQQRDLLIELGVPMCIKAIEEAVANAGIKTEDIGAIIYTSHLPFPFPPLSTHIMNKLHFAEDCVNMPCLSMGCAGGGYALRTARDYLLGNPTKAALIVNCELCSLGFRPHKKGMSWFLNTALFGDAVAASVMRGGSFQGGKAEGMQVVLGKQRHVADTTDVSFFTYDEWGYHFITTQALCEVAHGNAPQFAKDLVKEGFGNGKQPKDIKFNMIHPGGARMINDIGGALQLKDTESAKLAWKSMNKLGNVASATVTDMIAMAWDDMLPGDEAIVVGMGPGFVLDGVCLRMSSENDFQNSNEKAITSSKENIDIKQAIDKVLDVWARPATLCLQGLFNAPQATK